MVELKAYMVLRFIESQSKYNRWLDDTILYDIVLAHFLVDL